MGTTEIWLFMERFIRIYRHCNPNPNPISLPVWNVQSILLLEAIRVKKSYWDLEHLRKSATTKLAENVANIK